MLKVLIIYPKFSIYGGAETLIVKLCNYLTSQGVENGLLTTKMMPEIEHDLINTRIHVYKPENVELKHIFSALKKGVYELRKDYDILNPHNIPANLAVMQSRKPKVWMCNEPEAHLLIGDPRFRKTPAFLDYLRACIVETIFSRYLLKNAVVADEVNAKRFKRFYGYKPKIINYGVDYEFFSMAPVKNSLKHKYGNRFVVLQSGMMQPFKNQMASLEAINKVKDRIPNILLILTGAMLDEQYQALIEKYIEENDLQDYVFIKGHVNNDKIKEFYYISDVLLHPIKPQGGWLTPFEFLSTGRPIIVSEEFPPKSILVNNKIGTLTNDYARTLLDVYNNPNKYKQVAQKGKKFVEKNLQWDNYCANMLEYFKKVMEK